MTLTVNGVYAEHRGLFGSVPTTAEGACDVCLGRKNPQYATCLPCDRAGFARRIGRGPAGLLFPITTALLHGSEPPANWYLALRTYKRTAAGYSEHWTKVAAALGIGLAGRLGRYEAALGGPVDLVAPVPSSRLRAVEQLATHDLYRVLWSLVSVRDKLALTLVATADKQRGQFRPDAFHCLEPEQVAGRRIVLVDDSWITGGSAMSARQCLLAAGARAVVIVVAARVVNPDFARIDGVDPYHAAMLQAHDASLSPRRS